MINRIPTAFRWILGVKFNIRNPDKSAIVIFESASIEIFKDYSSPIKPVLLQPSTEIYIFILIRSILRRGRRQDAYIDEFIVWAQPKLIVTHVDNASIFYRIRNRHENIITIACQNGIRDEAFFDHLEGLYKKATSCEDKMRLDYFFTFGDYYAEKIKKYIDCEVVSIGSIRNNYHLKKYNLISNTVAYVSQWRNIDKIEISGKYYSHQEFHNNSDIRTLNFLIKYCGKKNKKLKIIPSSTGVEFNLERNYFNERCDFEFEYFDKSTNTFNVYDAVDESEIIVGVDSALLYESAARGTKTAFFSCRETASGVGGRNFGYPGKFLPTGLFWTNLLDESEFERVMNFLDSTDQVGWRLLMDVSEFKSLMKYNPGNQDLKNITKKILGHRFNLKIDSQ